VLISAAPQWHEKDGGRYVGTCDAVISHDPDSGYINAGTYRV
jgi:4-hydroxy-3-polyprenylbenzoate decarboxylase